MKFLRIAILLLAAFSSTFAVNGQALYQTNRAPLRAQTLNLNCQLGAVKPAGWLKEMLVGQKNGLSAHLDEHYGLGPSFIGIRLQVWGIGSRFRR